MTTQEGGKARRSRQPLSLLTCLLTANDPDLSVGPEPPHGSERRVATRQPGTGLALNRRHRVRQAASSLTSSRRQNSRRGSCLEAVARGRRDGGEKVRKGTETDRLEPWSHQIRTNFPPRKAPHWLIQIPIRNFTCEKFLLGRDEAEMTMRRNFRSFVPRSGSAKGLTFLW
jgi:hypothetical protein